MGQCEHGHGTSALVFVPVLRPLEGICPFASLLKGAELLHDKWQGHLTLQMLVSCPQVILHLANGAIPWETELGLEGSLFSACTAGHHIKQAAPPALPPGWDWGVEMK